MKIKLMLNGIEKCFDVEPDEYLIDTLRNHGYVGVKKGCDTGSCGVCTILMDGKAVLSCTILSCRVDGHKITTIEGIQEEAKMIGKYLVDEGVEQCGYCSPGTIMSISYLEKMVKNPSDADILHYLNGNLCRCSGYQGQLRAIKKYMEVKYHENS